MSTAARPATDGLAGRWRLRPGAPAGEASVHSSRPDLVPQLARGRVAAQMPDMLAAVFTLCSHAHRWTGQRALAAARGQTPPATEAERQSHRGATLREQLLRISLDWPRLLPGASAHANTLATALRDCAAWRDASPTPAMLAAVPDWLQQHWLGQPVGAWLAAYAQDPDGWPSHWAAQTDTPLARLLHEQEPALRALVTRGPALDLLSQTALTMPMLARSMASEVGFCSQPHWQGQHPDTGPWCRAADPVRRRAFTAWARLVARLVEVLRLSLPQGQYWLGHGACTLAPGEGLAWTEMARGLLVHRVQLSPGDVDDAQARVLDWQVLAPTEWNGHPAGVLAAALRCLAPRAADSAARLAVAFDPCVDFDITPAAPLGEDAGLLSPLTPPLTGAPTHA